MKQPYILRGIQRHDNAKPQYWGFGSRSGFDDGLIRGGIVTVADRIVADTVRIAKWMASPKGLLWIVKQIGLGLTNPKVEAIGGILTRQTRIHLGVTSLLSVPGTALGLHFTRHGIPFLNESSYYENVIKFKTGLLTGNPTEILEKLSGGSGSNSGSGKKKSKGRSSSITSFTNSLSTSSFLSERLIQLEPRKFESNRSIFLKLNLNLPFNSIEFLGCDIDVF